MQKIRLSVNCGFAGNHLATDIFLSKCILHTSTAASKRRTAAIRVVRETDYNSEINIDMADLDKHFHYFQYWGDFFKIRIHFSMLDYKKIYYPD